MWWLDASVLSLSPSSSSSPVLVQLVDIVVLVVVVAVVMGWCTSSELMDDVLL